MSTARQARDRILVLDGPPMVTADSDAGCVQWHATTATANHMAVELSAKQAQGVARVLDTLGMYEVAVSLRTAAKHAGGGRAS